MKFSFFTENGRLLSFGFIMALISSFGQTYFISIFGPEIQNEFGLSHTSWGTVYLIGTLGSAFLLTYSGSLIDRYNLYYYTFFAVILLAFACIFISYSFNIILLIIAIFLLRHSGQGLSSHISTTTMARFFDKKRGSAIAVASLGVAFGEALLPFFAVFLMTFIGWRWTYFSSSILLICILLPISIYLLKGYEKKYLVKDKSITDFNSINNIENKSWTRKEVLKDSRFYLLLPGLLVPGVVMTALFFHHLNIADTKNWSHSWVTGNYFIHSISTTIMALFIGGMVDKFKAIRLFEFGLIPIIFGLLCLSFSSNPYIIIPYMILIGLGSGFGYTAQPALIAEIYGVKYLGSIKSFVTSITVFGSAIGPVIMGSLMDLGFSIKAILIYFAIYAFISSILIRVALYKDIFKLKNK